MKKWQDGVEDCYDASDEVCLPWQFDCQFGAPRCIPKNNVNDKKIDCYSGFDEGCPGHFFVCRDRSDCIEPSKYLNGIADCKDRSDEPCPQNHFQCSDGKNCIPKENVQNGKDDCQDGSDEECTMSQFTCQCGAVRCVSAKSVLDGIWDCEDGSDEFVKNSTNRKCNQEHKQNRQTNFFPVTESKLCSDSNPCRQELGQVCVVIGGTWRCVCKLGTVRPFGSKKCVPLELLSRFHDSPTQNCSETNLEQFGLLEEIKFSRNQLEKSVRRAPSRIISRTTTEGIDGFLDFGAERVPFMFQTSDQDTSSNVIPDEIIDSYGTSSLFTDERHANKRCNPSLENSCGAFQKCLSKRNGLYSCYCMEERVMIDGKCEELIDECATGIHDCHSESRCVDAVVGYECLCKEGFLDTSTDPKSKPGRDCKKLINECMDASVNDCSQNAKCLDKPLGYTCRCHDGYVDISSMGARKPGRNCTKAINECIRGDYTCDPEATCIDQPIGYSCRCPHEYIDMSLPPETGKTCVSVSSNCLECDSLTSHCVEMEPGRRECKCLPGYVRNTKNASFTCQREKRE